MKYSLSITKNPDLHSLKKNLNSFLEENSALLPKSVKAKVLLKPNFNSNMNALTGNTTDLRVITVLIQLLQKKGYKNIIFSKFIKPEI